MRKRSLPYLAPSISLVSNYTLPPIVAAFDPVAPLDANVYSTSATTSTEAEIAAKAEQMVDSLSEVQVRACILARLETDIAAPPEFQTECLPAVYVDVHTKLKANLVSIINLLSTLGTPIPLIGAFISSAAGQVKQLLDYIDSVSCSRFKQ